MSIHPGPPHFPVGDEAERARFFHHLEWGTSNGYQYTNTTVLEADHPDWQPVPPEGWELNVDRWPQYDEEHAGWTRVGPGVLRNPRGVHGPELVAHWKRKARR